MKRGLNLLGKKGKRSKRGDEMIDFDEVFADDEFDEDADDKRGSEADEDYDDYPDEEFEEVYGGEVNPRRKTSNEVKTTSAEEEILKKEVVYEEEISFREEPGRTEKASDSVRNPGSHNEAVYSKRAESHKAPDMGSRPDYRDGSDYRERDEDYRSWDDDYREEDYREEDYRDDYDEYYTDNRRDRNVRGEEVRKTRRPIESARPAGDARNNARDSRYDARAPRNDARDPRRDARDSRYDDRDSRYDGRDARYDDRDARHDSRRRSDRRDSARGAKKNSVAASILAMLGNLKKRGGDKRKGRRDSEPVGSKIIDRILDSTFTERAAAIGALILLVAVVITIVFYSGALSRVKQIESFDEVGANFNVDGVVGAAGLSAIADKAKSGKTEETGEEEEQEEEKTAEQAENVSVKVTLTSIKSDMKIKFLDAKTNKLVGSVPFAVTVETPDGTKVTYDDHDQDGIIYKNNLTAGVYKITPIALSQDSEKYNLDLATQSLTIKDKAELKAVDVSNEVKKESEVNAAVEDTEKKEAVESELKDTVDYIESTKTAEDGNTESGADQQFETIDRSLIVVPSDSSRLMQGSVMKLAAAREKLEITEDDESEEDIEIDIGNDEEEEEEDNEDGGYFDGVVIDEDPAEEETPSENVKVEDEEEKKSEEKSEDGGLFEDITIIEETDEEVKESKKDESDKPVVEEDSSSKKEMTVTETVDVEPSSLSLTVGQEATVSFDGPDKVTFKSDNEKVATVSSKGVVKAVGAGETTVRVSAKGFDDGIVKVKVAEKKEEKLKALEFKAEKITVAAGETGKFEPKDTSLKIKYEVDGKEFATISSDGTVKGIAEGTAFITAMCDGYDKNVLTVIVTKQVAQSGPLKDKNGNIIYVKDKDGKYRQATAEDLKKEGMVFYIDKSAKSYKYTGWQTIDGKTYYYDKNGNYVTGEQVIQGAKYTFGKDGVLSKSSGTLGIDVSKWNGKIDWSKVKESGVNFAIIRCGYRGSTLGALIEDPQFEANIKGATSAGIKVGVYFFTQAQNEVEAIEEASMVLSLIKGYTISMPVYLDVEGSGGRGDAISVSQRTANVRAFCGTIQNAGYRAGVYSNKTWLSSKVDPKKLTDFNIWIAQYATAVSYNATRYDMWQYTSKGKISGISGNVDLNLLYN